MARARALSRIQSSDPVLNRLQDQLLSQVNPALRDLAALTERPTVTGSRGGNAALASLLSALDAIGLITDATTP